MACDRDHEAIKRDEAAWSAFEPVGIQPSYDEHGTQLELRNCSCHTTLCRPIRKEAA